jgi:hypothetical protein
MVKASAAYHDKVVIISLAMCGTIRGACTKTSVLFLLCTYLHASFVRYSIFELIEVDNKSMRISHEANSLYIYSFLKFADHPNLV